MIRKLHVMIFAIADDERRGPRSTAVIGQIAMTASGAVNVPDTCPIGPGRHDKAEPGSADIRKAWRASRLAWG